MTPANVEERPLAGQRVLVTRPKHEAAALADLLSDAGAEVLLQPVIEIAPPVDWHAADDALQRIDAFDWLVFSSANGVRYLLGRWLERDATCCDRLARLRLAAIGPATAEALATFGLRAELVPDEFRAESLADALAPQAAGRRVLLARASRGREVLAERLRAVGAVVEQVVVYQSLDVAAAVPLIAARLRAGEIDWITVTSSAIARSLVRLFGTDLALAKLASISPVTSDALRGCGFEPSAEADEYTMPGLVAAIESTR